LAGFIFIWFGVFLHLDSPHFPDMILDLRRFGVARSESSDKVAAADRRSQYKQHAYESYETQLKVQKRSEIHVVDPCLRLREWAANQIFEQKTKPRVSELLCLEQPCQQVLSYLIIADDTEAEEELYKQYLQM
jgi:hypothetical protein